MKENWGIGEKVVVIERTFSGEVFEFEGVITEVTDAYIETSHSRNAVTHPQWHGYMMAYSTSITKHYWSPNGDINIRKLII